jgi:hypothetical protein
MNIAVYCSSTANLPATWQEGAAATGRWIAQNGASMVYGGVAKGLMEIAAKACKEAGGTVVGVVPASRRNFTSELVDVRIPACDLNDRKNVMQLLADAFVVLPGGYGTIDEFASAFAYISFTNQANKHIIIYNPDGVYDSLLAQYHAVSVNGLMSPDKSQILKVATNIDELTAALDTSLENFNN